MSITNAYKANRSLTTVGTTPETGICEVMGGGHRGGGIQLSGTFVGTVQFEESIDGGTTWIAKTVYPAAGGAGVSSATAVGKWKFGLGGSTHFRVRCSAFTSGPIVVDIALTKGVDAIGENGGGGAAPIGGGITWGAPTAVTLTGSSQTLIAANANRKAIQVINRIGNAQVSYDLAGGTVTLIGGVQMSAGQRDWYTGAECPVGAITIIGTAAQLVTYIEGT